MNNLPRVFRAAGCLSAAGHEKTACFHAVLNTWVFLPGQSALFQNLDQLFRDIGHTGISRMGFGFF